MEHETGENRLHLEKKHRQKAQLVNSVNVYCYRAVSPPEPCESPPDGTLARSVETLERQERAWLFYFCVNYVQKHNVDADLSCDVSCVYDTVLPTRRTRTSDAEEGTGGFLSAITYSDVCFL